MQKIAVVTINYNTEDLLGKLIGCFIGQSYRNWVMVIVNNSPDNSALSKVIKNFNDSRIILAGNNKNLGYSRANNLGFEFLMDNKLIDRDDIVLFTNVDIVIKDKDFFAKSIGAINDLECGFFAGQSILSG